MTEIFVYLCSKLQLRLKCLYLLLLFLISFNCLYIKVDLKDNLLNCSKSQSYKFTFYHTFVQLLLQCMTEYRV